MDLKGGVVRLGEDMTRAEVNFPHPPPFSLAGIATLIGLDPDFAGVVDRAGTLPWRRRTPGFPGVLQAIVAQMISNQAAAAIWGRLRAVPGALDPATLIALPDDILADGRAVAPQGGAREGTGDGIPGRRHAERGANRPAGR